MPDRMPNRMSEDMSDRMPEDLPVRKCINVMVGITRSKVILKWLNDCLFLLYGKVCVLLSPGPQPWVFAGVSLRVSTSCLKSGLL